LPRKFAAVTDHAIATFQLDADVIGNRVHRCSDGVATTTSADADFTDATPANAGPVNDSSGSDNDDTELMRSAMCGLVRRLASDDLSMPKTLDADGLLSPDADLIDARLSDNYSGTQTRHRPDVPTFTAPSNIEITIER